MFTTRHICTRCASRLSAVQLPTAAGAVARSHPHLIASYATATEVLDELPPLRRGTDAKISGPRKHTNVSDQNSMDHAVSLFNEVINAPSRAAPENTLADWEVAGKLKVMDDTQSDYPPSEKLHAFKVEILPYFEALQGPAPKHIFMSASNCLGQIAAEVTRLGLLGFSVDISESLARIGNWDMAIRNSLVLNLCHILIDSKYPNVKQPNPAALVELIDMWMHITQLGRESQVGQPLAFTLPDTDEIHRLVQYESQEYAKDHAAKYSMAKFTPSHLKCTRALSTLFLAGSSATASKAVSGLLATTAALWDRRIVGQKIRPEAEPLLKAVATVLHRVPVSTADLSKLFAPQFNRVPKEKLNRIHFYVKGQWSQVTEGLLKTEDKSWGDTIVPTASRSGGSYLASVHRRLRLAHKARNKDVVKELWQTFKKKVAGNMELTDQLREDPEFMDFWIFVWCSLRHDEFLKETVQLMGRMEMEPTIKSYTAMMHGWKTAKNIDKIDALWHMLSESDIQLDSYIWVERVSAYIETGTPQRAVETLGEMMRLWKDAVSEGKQQKAVKPSIEVVNATLKELVRLDRQAAQQVLAWAEAEDIHPNVVTYNILLREAFRSGSHDSVPGLLASMRQSGVDPNSASFTIILDEVLTNMGHSPPAEQVQAVHQVLDDMSSTGVQPNQETYGKMLYAISSLRNGGADEAIKAVQDHARERNIPTTPHMITILIERTLRQPNPSMSRIQAILAEHNMKRITDGDQTLWERVMTAYAVTGNLAPAMAIFNDLENSGRPATSLSCLRDVLQALLDDGEWDWARQVVVCTLKNKMKGVEDKNGNERYWKHRFWFTAQARGLLEDVELPPQLAVTLGRQSGDRR
ncbi:hypothetical protein NLU13_7330 [Sarocladium strictum]|uniref:Uncharacterized protein n=1 Tax=Sarocladium strictum TaxID=5046 RepID=A0AA39GEZ4_SARSR|nr:hypothetical protein NLU13_7330 [Sarocladium strictum]